MKHVCLNMF